MKQGFGNVDGLIKNWGRLLESKKFAEIENANIKLDTAKLLENGFNSALEYNNKKNVTHTELFESWDKAQNEAVLNEVNSVGAGAVQNYDIPITSIVRRMAPQLIAHDIIGVQVIDRPSGEIFFLNAVYGADGTQWQTKEALHNEADTAFTGEGTHLGTNPFTNPFNAAAYKTGQAMDTATGETDPWARMSFAINKQPVVARTRNIRADVTMELITDLKRVHGLNAVNELTRIMADEMTVTINRQIIRTIYESAVPGAQDTTVPGTFNLDADADGRWGVEKYKGLIFQIEKEANKIAVQTRRGKGNVLICSSNVASALALAGILDYGTILNTKISMEVDTIRNSTFVGTMLGFRIYVDPYVTGEGFVIGYKGASVFDNGLVFCPYTMLEYVNGGVNWDNFGETGMGFKSRYAITHNPFTKGGANENIYWRKIVVDKI